MSEPVPQPAALGSAQLDGRTELGALGRPHRRGTAAVVLAAAGLLLSRVDLALLAVPLVVALAWTWDQRPDQSEPGRGTLTLTEPGARSRLRDRHPSARSSRGHLLEVHAASRRSTRGRGSRAAVRRPGRASPARALAQELVPVEYRFFGADAGAYSVAQAASREPGGRAPASGNRNGCRCPGGYASRCSFCNSSITASPLRESRFPVGSSASRMDGEPASARATATRCC